MARLAYLSTSDLASADHELLSRDLNLYYALAHSPAGARAFATPALYVRHDSPLAPRLRELAILQVGFITRTVYEYVHHIEIGLDAGLSREDILALAFEREAQATHFDELEFAVLECARELVAGPKMHNATFATLEAHLPTLQITDLIIVISTYCAVVRVLGALEIDLEARYEHFLSDFPLPS